MKNARRRQEHRGTLELIEEAAHLLRRAPAGVLALYYFGALPFVLAFLYFWADLSRNPFGNEHIIDAALGLAVLFLWMKLCQAFFARALRALVAGESASPWTWKRVARLFVSQATLHPLGLFLLPLSLVPILPFAWVFAFFQNATALADSESAEPGNLFRKAVRQAELWPRQNLLILLILLGFGLGVLLNWTTVAYLLPGLARMLFGIESVFSRGGPGWLNTTFFAGMLALTYLCVDPLVKAVYTLRCFYGESLKTGADLRAELGQAAETVPSLWRLASILLIVSTIGLMRGNCVTAEAPEAGSNASISATAPGDRSAQEAGGKVSARALDRAIGKVIQQNKFIWRMPRENLPRVDESEPGILARFIMRASSMVRRWIRAALDWAYEWLRKWFAGRRGATHAGSGYGWMLWSQVMLYGLLFVVVVGLAGLLAYIFRTPGRNTKVVATEPIQPVPDLADENVGPEHLPDEAWAKLGRELVDRGELRLAVRAFYLAGLAHLAARNLVTLAKFKSNRDYEREIGRRGHAIPELPAKFSENVSLFDRVWYGLADVNLDLVNQFAANFERIKASL